MKNFYNIRAVVIDFGFTLSSDLYFGELGSRDAERITKLLFSLDSPIGRRWMGRMVTSEDVAQYMSDHLGASKEDVLWALVRGCSRMSFNEAGVDFARNQKVAGRELALVTVNADIFRDVIVPSRGLDRTVDSIVSSSDFKTELASKQPLWDAAFAAPGPKFG